MKRRIFVSLVIAIAIAGSTTLATMWPVTAYQAVSVTAPTISLGLSDTELSTADLAALTVDLSNPEKVQWAGAYTQRAANRQNQIAAAYIAGTVSHSGFEFDIPAATITAMMAEVNALAKKIKTAQDFVDTLTD